MSDFNVTFTREEGHALLTLIGFAVEETGDLLEAEESARNKIVREMDRTNTVVPGGPSVIAFPPKQYHQEEDEYEPS
jgi:hypothetical protein